MVATVGNSGFEVDPAAVSSGGGASSCLRLFAQRVYKFVKFGCERRTLLRIIAEESCQFGVLNLFSGFAKAVLAVFADFDEVV